MEQVRHTFHFHGALAELLPNDGVLTLCVNSVAEGVRLLAAQIERFEEILRGYSWHIARGALCALESAEEILLSLGNTPQDVHFIPAVAGAKNGGAGKAIIGGLIMAVAIVGAVYTGGLSNAAFGLFESFTWGNMLAIGAMATLYGVSQMLTPQAGKVNYDNHESPDQRNSSFWQGPTNTVEQGHPVPLVYGRVRTGTIISATALYTERV